LKKVCPFCQEGSKGIDYKRGDALQRFVTERGAIRSRRKVGTCAKHQRQLSLAIKRARHLALLPYTADHIRGV
jgi:small subunit ribosomal protein S18